MENIRVLYDQPLGVGGMSEVYKGLHLLMDVDIAVKVIAREISETSTALAMMRDEAKILFTIQHPNIARVYDFGPLEDGRLAIVMELLHGVNLETLSRERRLSSLECERFFFQTLEALSFLEARNITHRDIKPSNLFLTSDNVIKVIDFGISTAEQHRVRMAGTAEYMAPEQQTSEPVNSHYSDLYSLGVSFIELLTGSTSRCSVANLRDLGCSKTLAELLIQITTPHPKESRGTATEILSRMSRSGNQGRTVLYATLVATVLLGITALGTLRPNTKVETIRQKLPSNFEVEKRFNDADNSLNAAFADLREYSNSYQEASSDTSDSGSSISPKERLSLEEKREHCLELARKCRMELSTVPELIKGTDNFEADQYLSRFFVMRAQVGRLLSANTVKDDLRDAQAHLKAVVDTIETKRTRAEPSFERTERAIKTMLEDPHGTEPIWVTNKPTPTSIAGSGSPKGTSRLGSQNIRSNPRAKTARSKPARNEKKIKESNQKQAEREKRAGGSQVPEKTKPTHQTVPSQDETKRDHS